ncbi:MAG: hypothetical protein WC372_10300 [Candidatus Neomarinimicrobiota bacterium]|jgi:hypothetical protein
MYSTEVFRNSDGAINRIVVSLNRPIFENLVKGVGGTQEYEKLLYNGEYGAWVDMLSVKNGDVIDFINTLVRDHVLPADRYINAGLSYADQENPADDADPFLINTAFGYDTMMHEHDTVYSQYLLPETECEGSNRLIVDHNALTVIADHVGLFTMFMNIRKSMYIIATLDHTVTAYATSIFPIVPVENGYQILNLLKTVLSVGLTLTSADGNHHYQFTAEPTVDVEVTADEHNAVTIVRDQIKAEYDVKIRTLTRNYDGQITKLQHDLAAERANKYSSSLRFIGRLYEQGWRLTDTGNGITFPGRIYAEHVLYSGKLYPLPDELREKFFVENLFVPINSSIRDVTGIGFFPHVEKTMGSDPSYVCIGDLGGMQFERILDLVGNLKTINVHSMFDNAATAAINCLIGHMSGRYYDSDGIAEHRNSYVKDVMTLCGTTYYNFITKQVTNNDAESGEIFRV